ncbi:hypothetical protein BH23CHL8_BH23CHL8_25830 [soil metagenome]
MSVWYLDDDAEITDAVARLRSAEDDLVILVVPAGSRIATGRINFRLLAREASARDLRLAVASPDEQVRSLAGAAGVLARATAEEAQAALERGDAPTSTEATETSTATDALDREMDGEGHPHGERRLSEAGATATTGLAGSSDATATRRVTRRHLALGAGAIATAAMIGGVTALQTLPTATVTLLPTTTSVGPILVTVAASVATETVDEASGEIPAQSVSIPLTVEGTFPATGSEAVESRARGEVVFSSAEQAFEQPISARTRVRTPDGVEFQTTEEVVLRPPSGGAGAAEVRAPIEAVRPGEQGNVPEGEVSVVPSLESQGVSVTNPEATSGGDQEVTPVITQDDYEAAATDLANRLAGELANRLREPDSVPEGLTLFPETARLGNIRHAPPPEELVGRPVDAFELTASVTAYALAVDESLVDQVAVARLARQAPAGTTLVPSSLSTEAGTGTARGDVINYAASAEGAVYLMLDPDDVLAQVRGLPVSEARSILGSYGTATVTVWPEFMGSLPDDAARIQLHIEEPGNAE